ncbi:Transcriptional regulator, AraC family [hydrothermal vent metagenome]|uniref:Transcriptional regulator, AraC family n=1 Tax=hydrothermal vent metagenome TaxID=652676 RepID=A0A1W1CRX6_9ZZZZ
MKNLPLISIEQTLSTYKNLHSKNPSFGMDIYNTDFNTENFFILENNGKGSKGIPIKTTHYACILTLKGGSLRHVNQFNYKITAHSLQLLIPESIHSFEDTEPDSKFLVLIFNRIFLADELEVLLSFHNKNLQPVDLGMIEFNNVLNLYKQLNIEYKNAKTDYKEVAKHLLIQVLYILKREKLANLKDEIQNRPQKITNQFLSLIEDNFKEHKSVKEYANILNITPKHLSETIKECLGKPALSFIHIRVIKEMQYLLCYSEMSIKQISSYLNFENSSAFGRFFKRNEGLSPKEYQLRFHD